MLFFAYSLDEEYQIVMSYRTVHGDTLFGSMWEPHQTSAFLCALLMKPYLALVGTTGVVIYLRLWGTLIHLGVTVLLYRVLKELVDADEAWMLGLIFFNTIPKEIMTPEFGIMQVWFFTLLMLCLYHYRRSGCGLRYLLLAALMMVLEVLAYPSCIILAPFVLVLIIISARVKVRDALLFTGSCLLCGIAYLGMLLIGSSPETLVSSVSHIIGGDVTHQSTALQKLQSAGLSLAELALLIVLCAVISLIARRICGKQKDEHRNVWLLTGMIIAACLIEVYYWTVRNAGYETVQIHLVVLTLVGALTYRKIQAPDKKMLLAVLIGSFLSLIAVLMLTDLTMMESIPHAMLAAFAGMILLISYLGELFGDRRKTITLAILGIWALTAIFGKGYPVRSGVDYANVLQSGGVMKYGPGIGTISNYMGAYVYNCDYEDWQSNLQDGDRVLIVVDQVMNLDTTQYLFKDVTISHYSIVNPTAYDERLIEYWELYPEKAPNVIIVDCWYGSLMTDPDSFIMNYIENEFGYSSVTDGRYIRIYRK